MKSIHIGIRPQLIILFLVVIGISVTIFAIVTGVNTTRYVVNLRREQLNVVAELKASQVNQAFMSMYYQVSWITNRDQVKDAMSRYRAGNTSDSNWADLRDFLNTTLGTYSMILGAGLYTAQRELVFNMTNTTVGDYGSLDPVLYPISTSKALPDALSLGGVVAGPSMVQPEHYMSITLEIDRNSTLLEHRTTTGFITLLLSSDTIQNVVQDDTGMKDYTTLSLIETVPNYSNTDDYDQFRYVLPPSNNQGQSKLGVYDIDAYPAVEKAVSYGEPGTEQNTHSPLSPDTLIVGYTLTDLKFCKWVVCIEEPQHIVYMPIHRIRAIVIGTSFGLAAFIVLITIPLAHFAVRPIYRLRMATEQTKVEFHRNVYPDSSGGSSQGSKSNSPKGKIVLFWHKLKDMASFGKFEAKPAGTTQVNTGARIPNHVPVPGRLMRDELSELSETYNLMAGELIKQYLSLEDQVTERTKEHEAAKIAAERANEAKSLFIANITHELRTPLNGILGLTAVCLTEKDKRKVQRSLRTIHKSGELLLNLLTDLLTFSKNQIGNIKLDEKEFSLSSFHQHLFTVIDPFLQDKETRLDFGELPAALQSMVLYGDDSRITQIMMNLISNAIKFSPPQGVVNVRFSAPCELKTIDETASQLETASKQSAATGFKRHRHRLSVNRNINENSDNDSCKRQVSMDSRATSLELVRQLTVDSESPDHPKDVVFEFEVEDFGPGIAEDMREQVFEPFVQGDQALSRKHGGTGLGLAICKQLAELMGGQILLRSEIGHGSTFTLKLPLKWTRTLTENATSLSRHASTASSRNVEMLGMSPLSEKTARSPGSNRHSDGGGYFGHVSTQYQTLGHLRTGSGSASVTTDSKTGGDLGNLKLLIAEDNFVNQEIIKNMLKLEGITDVTIAVDGEEAVNRVEESIKDGIHYDIVFMDLQMPKLNGLQATQTLRTKLNYPYAVIAMTAYADKDSENKCIESGMNGVITKPILRDALNSILRNYRPGQPLHEPSSPPERHASQRSTTQSTTQSPESKDKLD